MSDAKQFVYDNAAVIVEKIILKNDFVIRNSHITSEEMKDELMLILLSQDGVSSVIPTEEGLEVSCQ